MVRLPGMKTLRLRARRPRHAPRPDTGRRIPVYFPPQDWRRLQEAAERAGCSTAAYIKRAAMAHIDMESLYRLDAD